MTFNLRRYILFLFIAVGLLFCASGLFAQERSEQKEQTEQQEQAGQQEPPPRVSDPTKINYYQRVEKAKREYHLGRTYFASYLKIKELNYLNLAASHTSESIKQFFETELRLAKNTKFYYEVKYIRLNVCAFYKKIQKRSFELPSNHFLGDLEPRLCTR